VIATRPSLLSLCVACLAACSTAPRREPAPPAATADRGPPDAPSPEPSASTDEQTVASHAPAAPSSEPPPATWIDPLPKLVLTRLDETQQARANACLEGHDIDSPSATPAAILAAADCMAAIPAPGHEIRLYKHLSSLHPDAPEALDAMRRMGARYEQIDQRSQAIDAYAAYLRHYPKQADARTLAQRAVCLARSLGDGTRVDALLAELERLYGRRGFARPSNDELARLCAPLPPLAPRPE
jgi:hypothetical protein